MTPSYLDEICTQVMSLTHLTAWMIRAYFNRRLVRLDFAYFVELLNPSFRLDEPLYDLHFLDAYKCQQQIYIYSSRIFVLPSPISAKMNGLRIDKEALEWKNAGLLGSRAKGDESGLRTYRRRRLMLTYMIIEKEKEKRKRPACSCSTPEAGEGGFYMQVPSITARC